MVHLCVNMDTVCCFLILHTTCSLLMNLLQLWSLVKKFMNISFNGFTLSVLLVLSRRKRNSNQIFCLLAVYVCEKLVSSSNENSDSFPDVFSGCIYDKCILYIKLGSLSNSIVIGLALSVYRCTVKIYKKSSQT